MSDIAEIARRYGVSENAAETLLRALRAGGGTMAQFSHPELGGMGQWSRGGMIMIGDMFNNALKAKVDALCHDLAGVPVQPEAGPTTAGSPTFTFGQHATHTWWPGDFGSPSSTGSQNGVRYASFGQARRVAIDVNGHVTVYDTGDHVITGVAQAQGGTQTLTFSSQNGYVRAEDLRVVSG